MFKAQMVSRFELSQEEAEILDLDEFSSFLHKLRRVCFYMVLHVPELHLPKIEPRQRRTFTPKDHYCMDGFPKSGNLCTLILSPPMRLNQVYMGIKGSVLMIHSSDFIQEPSLFREKSAEIMPVFEIKDIDRSESRSPDRLSPKPNALSSRNDVKQVKSIVKEARREREVNERKSKAQKYIRNLKKGQYSPKRTYENLILTA